MLLDIPDEIAQHLEYYLSRSVRWFDRLCVNQVAEEAECVNGLAMKAMKARTVAMYLLREKRLENKDKK